MATKYAIYIKDPNNGKIKRFSFDSENKKKPKKKSKPKIKEEKPRYWSSKFWKKKDISEVLNEIVDPDSINVDQLKLKNELNPDIWESEDKMYPDVRAALLKNAIEFINFANLEKAKFKDIILTGSLANYNWHEGSDLDVHILMDITQIANNKEFVGDYFKTKKSLWADRLPIKVKGHDVEVYVQDINEPHASTGVYSLLHDHWLTKPIHQMIGIDVGNIQLKAADFMNAIDDLELSANPEQTVREVERLMDKIKEYRKAGLQEEGEFSTENLVFKILRNNGYLEKLDKLKLNALTKELSLEDYDYQNNVSMYDGGTLKGEIVDNVN